MVTVATPLRTAAAIPGVTSVDAVLVVHDGRPWLARCLEAVLTQTLPLRRLAVVLTGADDEIPSGLVAGDTAVRAVEARGLDRARAIQAGMTALRAHGDLPDEAADRWVWLVEDDCFPEPDCLATLLAEATLSSSIAIAGPKHVDATYPGRLVEVGRSVSSTGRRVDDPRHGELDQGQHDRRSDVLAVSTGAMVVRADALAHLGGLDPALRVAGDLDLCWRAHQAGYRVVVVPQARVLDARASAQGLRSRERLPFAGLTLEEIDDERFSRQQVMRERRAWERERRRAVARADRADRLATRAVALARASTASLPWTAARICAGSVVLSVLLLVLKRPRAAVAELSDALAVLTPWRWFGARRRGRRTAVVSASSLRGLLASTSTALRGVRDQVYLGLPVAPTAVEPERTAEPGPISDEALDLPGDDDGARVARHPGVIAVLLATVVSVVGWWPVLGQGIAGVRDRGLVGGYLVAGVSDASSVWTRWLTGWSGAGLGSGETAPPWLPLVAAPAWLLEHLPGRAPTSSVSAAVALLVVLASPLAALSAYVAASVVTPRPWPRALAALAWSWSPALLVGVHEGRLGVAILAVTLPLAAAGLAACADDRPWWPAVGGSVLAATVTAAVAPGLLLVSIAVGLWLAVVQHGRGRVAGLIVAVLPPVLLGPSVLSWAERPARLLTGPGLVQEGPSGRPWLATVLWPLDPASWGAASGLPAWMATGVTFAAVPLVLAGLWGLGVSGRRGPGSAWLAIVALISLVAAVMGPRLTLAQTVGADGTVSNVTTWSGTALLVLTLTLLAAALGGVAAVGRPGRSKVLRWSAAALTAVVGVGVAVQGAWLGGARLGGQLAVAPVLLPSVARDATSGSFAGRYLGLEPRGHVVTARILPGDPAAVARDLPVPEVANDELTAAARTLVVGDDGAVARSASDRLASAGVAFVGVAAPAPEIAARLDTTAGLTRLTDAGGAVPLWRVALRPTPAGVSIPVSLVRVLDAKGAPLAVVPVDGPGPAVDASLPAAASTLVVAQGPGWSRTAEVRVDGREVSAAQEAGLTSYELPAGARHVTVTPRPPHPTWTWVQGVALALVVLLALPFGVRRRAGGEVLR